jgi:methionyl-tRNA formyltransferase
MHVGLITYETGHRKTLEVALKLLTKGYRVTLFAFPFVRRATVSSHYADRPFQLWDFDVHEFCRQTGIGYHPVEGWSDDHAAALSGSGADGRVDVFLCCIAKIIPAAFIEGRVFLNCHPGLLPYNRGVDAFKWSIVNGDAVGVTLHAIDEAIDRGAILYRRPVPILSNDTLPVLCQRAYDFECDLLANFDLHLKNLRREWLVGDSYPLSRKRIPKEIDDRLEQVFLEKRAMLIDAAQRQSWQWDSAGRDLDSENLIGHGESVSRRAGRNL